MKRYRTVATFHFVSTLIVLSLFAAGAGSTAAGEFPDLTDPDFGQPPPGLETEDLISQTSRYDEPDEVAQIYWVDSAVIEIRAPATADRSRLSTTRSPGP